MAGVAGEIVGAAARAVKDSFAEGFKVSVVVFVNVG